jgi:hypothetical protein
MTGAHLPLDELSPDQTTHRKSFPAIVCGKFTGALNNEMFKRGSSASL